MPSIFRPLCAVALSAVLGLSATSATAQLRLPINSLAADSFQTFSDDAVNAFAMKNVTVTARGNTREADGEYRMPITEIYLGPSKYTGLGGGIFKGGSIGAALEFTRIQEKTGQRIGLTLANFRIDYHSKKVIADVTPIGGTTTPEQAIYDFQVIRPIVQEPNAQGKLVMEELLGDLRLTPEAVASFTKALSLDAVSVIVIKGIDFGTLFQSINLTIRATTPATPYIAK